MNAGSRPMNVLLHSTQRPIGCGRKRRAVRSRTRSGSSSDTTLAGPRMITRPAPFSGARTDAIPFAESAFRRRTTARLGLAFNPGRFMADALYITGARRSHDTTSRSKRRPHDRRELVHPPQLGRRPDPDRSLQPLARAVVPGRRGPRAVRALDADRRPSPDL